MAADETLLGTKAQASPPAALLRCTEVGKSYADGRQEVWAVRGASLALAPGEIALLVGPSGSGKSTLLALASGLARPTEGEVELAGLRFSRLPERLRTEHRRRQVGLVFQQLQLLEQERVLDNVVLPLLPWGVPAAEAERRALRLLAELGLAGLARSRVGRLSGGEMQRVALARALVIDPPLLLLDEPTSHLDAANADILLAELERLRGQGRAILVATHDPRVVERLQVDQLFQMRDGRLRAAAPGAAP